MSYSSERCEEEEEVFGKHDNNYTTETLHKKEVEMLRLSRILTKKRKECLQLSARTTPPKTNILYCFFFGHGITEAWYGISVPRPGIEPELQRWKCWVLTTRSPENSLFLFFLLSSVSFSTYQTLNMPSFPIGKQLFLSLTSSGSHLTHNECSWEKFSPHDFFSNAHSFLNPPLSGFSPQLHQRCFCQSC